MNTKDFEQVYDYLLENDYFTEKELELVTNINGNSIETLNDMLYARFGYRDIEQMLED